MKSLFGFLTILAVLFSGMGIQSAMAQGNTDVWDGSSRIDVIIPSDDGWYEVSRGSQLAWLADQINTISEYRNIKIRLKNSLDLSGGEWTPIGKSDSTYFTGEFDGKGFEITLGEIITVPYSNSSFGGLFSINAGLVKNTGIRLRSSIMSVKITTTGLSAAYLGGIAGSNVKNPNADTGRNYEEKIENCYVLGELKGNCTSTSTTGPMQAFAGLLVGSNSSNIENCYVAGSVNLSLNSMDKNSVEKKRSASYAGGLAGQNRGNISGAASDATVTATLINPNPISDVCVGAGGLVGYGYSGIIDNSFAKGVVRALAPTNVIQTTRASGLVGFVTATSTVINCYAICDVSAPAQSAKLGAIVYASDTSGVTGSYYYADSEIQYNKAVGTGCTKLELQNSNTYSGWDFVNMWMIDPNKNDGYPLQRYHPGDSGLEFENMSLVRSDGIAAVMNVKSRLIYDRIVYLVLVAYRDGKMIKCTFTPETVTKGVAETWSTKLLSQGEIPDGATFKLMVWDGVDKPRPLANTVQQ